MEDTINNIISDYSEQELKERKKKIKAIFDSSFPKDISWNNWFFDKVYRDDESLLLEVDGKAVSSLFLQKYGFNFHGEEVQLGYIAGAATDRNLRQHGYMSELIKKTIKASFERGDVFVALIPASRRLYFFYDKFGFATVYYVDIERYTSLHTFTLSDGYREAEPLYKDFSRLERERSATVLHSLRDFENILEDIEHDRGTVAAVSDPDGVVRAMAFASENEDEIHVKELLADDERAAEMALAIIKQFMGEKPMVVYGAPEGRKAGIRTRGMMRIVNVEKAFSSLAKRHPEIDQVIKVRDSLIESNNGYFKIKRGVCKKIPFFDKPVNLDVSVTNLTKILFSSEHIGEIFNLPTSHALLPLMLD